MLTSELKVGDHVIVKPGAKIPVDGVVLDGRSAVDQSPLTGESVPLDKGPRDDVLAGSLNQFGVLTIEARKVAEQTVAGKVIELTTRALKDKTSGERTADRLARLFLPVVLGLAALTFLVAFGYHVQFRAAADAWRRGACESLSHAFRLGGGVPLCPYFGDTGRDHRRARTPRGHGCLD